MEWNPKHWINNLEILDLYEHDLLVEIHLVYDNLENLKLLLLYRITFYFILLNYIRLSTKGIIRLSSEVVNKIMWLTGGRFSGMVWHGQGTVYKKQILCHRQAKLGWHEDCIEREFMKQISFNKIDFNFANIINLANTTKYPKICDFCNNIFEISLEGKIKTRNNSLRCPICFSLYYVVYNELNEFYYLEFAKAADDYVMPADYRFQLHS